MVPIAVNFSALEKELEENNISYEPGDGGLEQARLQDKLEYEELVVQILINLEPREKMVFAFQLLRDGGYQIDHGACAKVVNLSRRQYMRVLDDVRLKVALFIAGYKQRGKKNKSHKEDK